jgi:hypothetical protein
MYKNTELLHSLKQAGLGHQDPLPSTPPEPQAPSPRLLSAYQKTRSSLRLFHGGLSSLPKDLPSKSTLASSLNSLPRYPSVRAVSEAATLFQFRKLVPGDLDHQHAFQSFKERTSRAPLPASPAFQMAADQAVDLLGPDWDKTYEMHVNKCVPTLGSNLEKLPPSSLPPFAADTFKDICMGRLPPLPIPPVRKFKTFLDGGKMRSVTIASILQLQLAPLSSCLYDTLVRTKAILRGPATPATLAKMKSCKDEEFVSGDYQASTDNFILDNTQYLISALRRRSTRIPDALFQLLSEFMGPCTVFSPFGEFKRTSGQYMGDRPSFSLLCLTNLAGVFLGLGPEEARSRIKSGLVKINGDDILLRLPAKMRESWMNHLPLAGLVLEKSKTLTHPTVLTLNSSFFTARPRRLPRSVFFLRASSLFGVWTPLPASWPSAHSGPSAAAQLVSRLYENVRHTNTVGSVKLAFHLLRSAPRSAACAQLSSLVVPPLHPAAVPPDWRRAFKAVTCLAPLYRAARAPPPTNTSFELPPEVRRTTIRPRDAIERSVHLQISQYMAFRRNPEPRPPPSLVNPNPRSITLLGVAIPFRPGIMLRPTVQKNGIGMESLPTFYRLPPITTLALEQGDFLHRLPPPQFTSSRGYKGSLDPQCQV